MGILNVTPDSFSDGGLFLETDAAIHAGMRMAEEGADIIDVGGESTRPGSEGVTVDEELRRVLPVVSALASEGLRVSIDTSKAVVAQAGLEAGAWMVNDVTALSDAMMPGLFAEYGCAVCLMHMQGKPRSMQANPHYDDVITEVREFLLGQAAVAEEAGVDPEKIWLDPGIGFGKTVEHNLTLLQGLSNLVETGHPILVGVSRKSFLAKLSEGEPLSSGERLAGTLAVQTLAQASGARCIRAHDVKEARRAIDAAAAVLWAF